MKRVHITNGEFFNQWLKQHLDEPCVPFNEAMMSYMVQDSLFSASFIKHRAATHSVSVDQYKEKMKEFFELIEHLEDIDELVLWFGLDAFCQMNLLTVLKVLKDKNYQGIIETVIFDENESWEKTLTQKRKIRTLNDSDELFQKVLVEKQFFKCDDIDMNHGIELFLDYHSETGKLSKLVRSHPEMDEHSLVILLLENSKEYGLSDVQAKTLIQKVRSEVR